MKIIQVIELAGIGQCPESGKYISGYDPHEDRGGYGKLSFTDDPLAAMAFPDAKAAMDFWLQKSKTVPIRPDGKPNRPLTQYTVLINDLPRSNC